MLISHPPLDSTFSNPVDSLILPYSSTDDSYFPTPKGQQGWLAAPSTQDDHLRTSPEDDFGTSGDQLPPPPPLERLLHQPEPAVRQEDDFRTADPSKDYPDSRVYRTADPSKDYPDSRVYRTSEYRLTPLEGLLLHQLKDCLQKDKQRQKPKAEPINKLLPAEVMSAVDPEDDLRCLVENERKLELCGYYYGNLSWLDASHLLRQCRVGTFLVRDSEHGSYLYTLSVQTRKGPTSCRIEYVGGSFRLDSSKDLSHKMPRFDCVTHLIDFYVRLPRYLPPKNCNKAVWLDMDEENTLDVPVQIYRPLYRQVRSLQHMCRVAIMGEVGDKYDVDPLQGSVLPCKPYRTNPSATLQTALEKDPQYSQLPNIIKSYLSRYPYSQ